MNSTKFARRSRVFSHEGGIGVARLKDSPPSEARMIAECADWIRLSIDDSHSSIASSKAAVLTTSWRPSTSSVSLFYCSRAVSSSTCFTQCRTVATPSLRRGGTNQRLSTYTQIAI